MSTTITTKTYEPLTESSAILLAKQLHLFEDEALLTCKEIGDGNLNLVFHVRDQAQKSFIIKQALPYAKVVGESWPLTLKRATIEAEALKTFAKYVPQFVPTVFYSDEQLAITIMEDLSHLTIARTGLIEGEHYPLFSKHIGEYLAKTLFYTSDYAIDPIVKKELQQSFINPELCKITEDLIFTDPFYDAATNDFEDELSPSVYELWDDSVVKLEVAKLKKSFLTEAESLLHGDLHTGSVFVNKQETKVIDPEFAFYGPAGFDIGQIFANLIFQIISREPEHREVILNDVKQVWVEFEKTYTQLWEKDAVHPFATTQGYLPFVLQKTFSDSIGFAGCELIRRTIGLAHVKDLDGIKSHEHRINAKLTTIELGKTLITNRNSFKNIETTLQHVQLFIK